MYAGAVRARTQVYVCQLLASEALPCRLTTACSRRPSQSSNLHAQICRLSGARLMLAVRRHVQMSRRIHDEGDWASIIAMPTSDNRRSSSSHQFVAASGCSLASSPFSSMSSSTTVTSMRLDAQRHRRACMQMPSCDRRIVSEQLMIVISPVRATVVGMSALRQARWSCHRPPRPTPVVRWTSRTRSVRYAVAQRVQSVRQVPPNHCMQPTPQPVIKFACANLSPVWCAADAGC